MEKGLETMNVDTLVSLALTGSVEEQVKALSSLCAFAKKREWRRSIEDCLGSHAGIVKFLSAEEPKLRKNAARLLGALGDQKDIAPLGAALKREGVRFVIPSLLLALGELGGEEAYGILNTFEVPAATARDEEKHCMEIAEAYRKAMSHVKPSEVVQIHTFNAPQKLLLLHPQGFTDVLTEELRLAGLHAKGVSSGVMTEAQDLDRVYKIRSFFEALIPCSIVKGTAEEIAEAARKGWASFSLADAGGAPLLSYRIELRDYEGDRVSMIRSIANAVGGTNDPSAYSFEIRIRFLQDGRVAVYVKPCAVRDVRFNYRVGMLPASIHPATAAAIARQALSMLPSTEGVLRVFDPCCGSGTMLIETARAYGRKNLLMGTDIAQNAVDIAQKNGAAACCHMTVLRKDCLRFEARDPFDMLITNLPFGNRVGSHESVVPLYQGLVKKLRGLVKQGGIAVLYTVEGKLLERCLKDGGFRIVKVVRTDAGGLSPRAYFVQM